jgi:tryptophan-rich sensory protein
LSLVLAIVACELVGASGSLFTVVGLDTWYPSLVRPALAPPNWVFGPVWTVLFALLGIAVWLVWRRPPDSQTRLALGVFAGQFVVNVAWSAVFFGLQSLLGGLLVIAVLWGAIALTMWAFSRVDRTAAALLVPYLLWVSFAAYLNYSFWVVN